RSSFANQLFWRPVPERDPSTLDASGRSGAGDSIVIGIGRGSSIGAHPGRRRRSFTRKAQLITFNAVSSSPKTPKSPSGWLCFRPRPKGSILVLPKCHRGIDLLLIGSNYILERIAHIYFWSGGQMK